MPINRIESNIVGDRYRRSKTVTLNNPKQGGKSIVFEQEDVINLLDGTSAISDVGSLIVTLNADIMAKTIDVLDPISGVVIAKKTVSEMVNTTVAYLYSLSVYQENLLEANTVTT